ncbi:MAG TPA: GNAT family N-acetyltransferase [Symbiobacteriaceae bacterium]|nr:GNAT family N-acetyltransferase [Symbiobacteriaceae bacterium]
MDPIRLENHWLTGMATAGGGGRTTRLPGAIAVANPQLAGTTFSFIALRSATPDHLADTLEMGSALLAAEGRAPLVCLSPLAGDVPTLTAGLESLGWKQVAAQVVLIRPLPGPDLPAPRPDVQVGQVEAGDLPAWGETLVEAYEVEPIAGEAIAAGWTSLAAAHGDDGEAQFYLARLEGKPAGTGLTWLRAGLAGLYCGAVLPAVRRRGVERATLLRRLTDAAAKGAEGAYLQTEVGSPVEQLCRTRLNFAVSHTRTLWIPRCG